MLFITTCLFILLNTTICVFLRKHNAGKYYLLAAVVLFMLIFGITKLYVIYRTPGTPEPFGIFVTLFFSWSIIVMSGMIRYIFRSVFSIENVSKNILITVVSALVTAYQIWLILSEKINYL